MCVYTVILHSTSIHKLTFRNVFPAAINTRGDERARNWLARSATLPSATPLLSSTPLPSATPGRRRGGGCARGGLWQGERE